LRRGVSSDTSGLVLVLGIVMLLVGGVGIANVTLASVLERRRDRASAGAWRDALRHSPPVPGRVCDRRDGWG